MKKISVIDYGMSNLHSVLKSFQKVIDKKYSLSIAKTIKDLEDASIIILPGQGAANSCMDRLNSKFPSLDKFIINRPFFGICLGFQILFNESSEDGGVKCFSIIDGTVTDFKNTTNRKLKIPHMGWNIVNQNHSHPIWKNISNKSFFYFVHSYYAQATKLSDELSTTDYGINFTSSVIKDNIFACQYHPEKSSSNGLQLLSNFITYSEGI
ncbi:MAG: imidazole glycerol phosphate synthase subunit HisH [Gammaproteobacteria bacterium]|nr:imidazole glycerol phosphate synthase subunit HisH [Gammaproteobacteria bacterium]MBL6819290.1 imidazole glycerol phosphate synthase subunit HisH [Gammaproteobacteria bacterium]MBL6898469.1 imidazole glycerol phosphate synthase subunit HisH [Gammaproteobacteria bacterium]